MLTMAMNLRPGDRVVNCGNTGDTTPSAFTVKEVDGCGWGNNVRCWLRLTGTDARGVRHEVIERLPLEAPVFRLN